MIKKITKNIITKKDLLLSLPVKFKAGAKLAAIHKIKNCFDYELEYMCKIAGRAAAAGHDVTIFVDRFTGNDRQAQNFFSVSARDLPRDDKVNWYGQNTSQWLYAGCIAVDNTGYVSTHH